MKKISTMFAAISIATLGVIAVSSPSQEVEAAVFSSCDEAWQAGYADIPLDAYGYSKSLDRDHDGVACELENDTEGLFRPRVEQPTETAVSEPQSTDQATEAEPKSAVKEEVESTETAPVTTQKTLPQTSAVK